MAAAFVPTGWPDGVHPPGSPGFEQTAVSWLLDVVPPDYRLHGVLTQHPVALATLAGHHLAACVEGARQGYRCARAELGKDLPPGSLAAVLAAYKTEGQRLVAARRAADLVSRALRGETFVPQFGGPPDSRRLAAEPATGSGRGPAASPPASGSAAGLSRGRAGEGATGRGAAR